MLALTLKCKLELGPQLPVHGHAGSAHECIPPLVHKLRLAPDQPLDKLVLVLPAARGVDQELGAGVVKALWLLPPDVELPEVLDIGTVGELSKQLLPEPGVVVEVRDLGEVDKGDLPRGLEEGVEVELLVVRLTEGDGQRSVPGKRLKYGRGIAEGREQSGGPVPALIGQEGGVDLTLESSVEVPPLGQDIARSLILEHPEVCLGLCEQPGADAVALRALDSDPEVLERLAVLRQLVQLGAPECHVKHLGAGLAGGEVRHPGDEGGEWLPVTLGEVAEQLVSRLAAVGC